MVFDETITELRGLGSRAQATFMKRYIMRCGAGICRSIIRYAYERLDQINEQLPDTDPGKQLHYARRNPSMYQYKGIDLSGYRVGTIPPVAEIPD